MNFKPLLSIIVLLLAIMGIMTYLNSGGCLFDSCDDLNQDKDNTKNDDDIGIIAGRLTQQQTTPFITGQQQTIPFITGLTECYRHPRDNICQMLSRFGYYDASWNNNVNTIIMESQCRDGTIHHLSEIAKSSAAFSPTDDETNGYIGLLQLKDSDELAKIFVYTMAVRETFGFTDATFTVFPAHQYVNALMEYINDNKDYCTLPRYAVGGNGQVATMHGCSLALAAVNCKGSCKGGSKC